MLVWALAFAVAGPTAWNSLSDDLRDPTLSTDSFRRLIKIRLFSEYWYIQHIRGITLYLLYKFTTYLLTYMQYELQSHLMLFRLTFANRCHETLQGGQMDSLT